MFYKSIDIYFINFGLTKIRFNIEYYYLGLITIVGLILIFIEMKIDICDDLSFI